MVDMCIPSSYTWRKTKYGSIWWRHQIRRTIIRDSQSAPQTAQRVEAQTPHLTSLSRKSRRKYFTSNSVAMYAGVFLLIMSMVAVGYQPPQRVTAAASAVNQLDTDSPTQTMSVDDVIATNVAANIAQTANLPIASNVANLSQSLAAESVLTENESNIVTKPQIVQLNEDSREIQTYTAKAGDTVDKIAKRYGVSAQTIKWANDLTSDAVEAGKKIKILPVDGVIYTVKGGDSIDSIAKRYNANKTALTTFNDLDIDGLSRGQQIIILNGTLPTTERLIRRQPATVASNSASDINYGSYSGGSGTTNPYAGASVGNRYAFGNCTWYAYERRSQLGRPVGSFWGNANTWSSYARSAGFNVNGSPAAGAVMEGGGWAAYGHVAIVESVNPGVSVTVSEMNAYRFDGGFNRIGRGTISWGEATSGMYRYIH